MRSSRKALRAIASNELIGLEARVVRGTDPSLEGLRGRIADETMNTVELETAGKSRVLDKRGVVLAVRLPGGEVEVAGRELLQRPDERLKKLWKKVK